MIIKTDNQNYFDIAAAIREKNETDEVYKPSEMALAIANIESGGIPCTLTVKTAEGALVEATLGSKKASATAGADGTAILVLEKEGLWTVSATLDGETMSTEILVEHNVEANLSFFPGEPSSYEQIVLITSSQTWEAPENGYFQIEVFGASGNGGNAAMHGYYAGTGGGGGGGGAAISRVKLKKGDVIELNSASVGATSYAIVNSSLETYDTLSVTSGSNGGNGYSLGSSNTRGGSGGSGGSASGGNYANYNGKSGGNGSGNRHTVGDSYAGGGGGAAGYTGGNAGGHGAGSYMNMDTTMGLYSPGAGSAGFFKIYRGNTN